MKKIYIGLATALLTGVYACSGVSEIYPDTEKATMKKVVISATHETDPQTKTALQDDGSIWWKPEDWIGVFFGQHRFDFFSVNTTDVPTTDFVGYVHIIEGNTENSSGNSESYTYWGVYPIRLGDHGTPDEEFNYEDGNADYVYPTREQESVNVYLPARQKAVAGTFDNNLFISVARSNDYKKLTFYNLCGGLAFCVEKEGINRVTFKGNAGETLAGEVNVVMNSEGYPVVNEVRNGKTEIVLDMPYGEYFIPGKMYYMVMLPTVLSEGYTMRMEGDADVVFATSSAVEVKRSVFGRLTNPDSDAVPAATSVELSCGFPYVRVGGRLKLEATITPSQLADRAVWRSLNPDIATVDEDGYVSGVSAGVAQICVSIDGLSDVISVTVSDNAVLIMDGDFNDWDALDPSAVSVAFCDPDSPLTGLKAIGAYADADAVYVYLEYDDEVIVDHSWTPVHIFLNADGSTETGGYGDRFTEATCEWCIEGAIHSDGEFCSYYGGLFPWTGEIGGYGWSWGDGINYDFTTGAGKGNKYEIMITKELCPEIEWAETFGLGVEIEQNWNAVGVLPNAACTQDNPQGLAPLLSVTTY